MVLEKRRAAELVMVKAVSISASPVPTAPVKVTAPVVLTARVSTAPPFTPSVVPVTVNASLVVAVMVGVLASDMTRFPATVMALVSRVKVLLDKVTLLKLLPPEFIIWVLEPLKVIVPACFVNVPEFVKSPATLKA